MSLTSPGPIAPKAIRRRKNTRPTARPISAERNPWNPPAAALPRRANPASGNVSRFGILRDLQSITEATATAAKAIHQPRFVSESGVRSMPPNGSNTAPSLDPLPDCGGRVSAGWGPNLLFGAHPAQSSLSAARRPDLMPCRRAGQFAYSALAIVCLLYTSDAAD